jgi:hypothetical protein
MFKVLSHGDNKHRLEDSAGEHVGWVHGHAIGFRGFVTQDDARDAAIAARKALDAALERQYLGWPRREPILDRVRTVHDGAYEWFTDGTAPIARLLRPQRRAYDSSYGIELVLPSFASEGVAITVACSVASAIAPYRDAFTDAVDRSPRNAEPIEVEMPVPL